MPSFVRLFFFILLLLYLYVTIIYRMDNRSRELFVLQREVSLLKNQSGLKSFPETIRRNEFDRKRILITGGAGESYTSTAFTNKPITVHYIQRFCFNLLLFYVIGFVGSHLTDVLMKAGHEVTVLDNFFTGRKKNVEHWFVV